MIARKIELGLITKGRIDQGMMTTISHIKTDELIIAEMIDMMMTDAMSIVGIITIIRQEEIKDNTRITDTMMIAKEMMTDMIVVNILI